MQNSAVKPLPLLMLLFASLLSCGTAIHAGEIDKLEAQAIQQKEQADEATRKANAAAAQKEKDRKAAAAKAEADRIAGLQRKCEKNGGDWKRGRCVMPPPPEPKPQPANPPSGESLAGQAPTREATPAAPLPVGASPAGDSSATTSHYRINGDGTVTDTQTGLMWKQCSEGQSGGGCSGEVATYKWDDAMSRFGSGVSFAGYSDWRMPTKDELKSLVYCSNGTPTPLPDQKGCGDNYQSPTIDQQAFPNTASWWYWSSTAKDASGAWYVGFNFGYDYWYDRSSVYAVRLVRSGQ